MGMAAAVCALWKKVGRVRCSKEDCIADRCRRLLYYQFHALMLHLKVVQVCRKQEMCLTFAVFRLVGLLTAKSGASCLMCRSDISSISQSFYTSSSLFIIGNVERDIWMPFGLTDHYLAASASFYSLFLFLFLFSSNYVSISSTSMTSPIFIPIYRMASSVGCSSGQSGRKVCSFRRTITSSERKIKPIISRNCDFVSVQSLLQT